MANRHESESRQRVREDTVGKPAGKNDVILRLSDQTVEWTDKDRALWQQAHEPWWKPLSD